MKRLWFAFSLVLSLASCKTDTFIRVAATKVPHAEILEAARPLLKAKGYSLSIETFSNYSFGNTAVASEAAHANFFQHLPHLKSYNRHASPRAQLVNVGAVHLEPIGIYAGTKDNIEDIEPGDKIVISDNVSDYGRIVAFLTKLGLAEITANFDPTLPLSHPEVGLGKKKVGYAFKVIPAEKLVESLKNKEGEFFLINGNYALEGGLNYDDALAFEEANNNPFANIIAVRVGDEELPRTKALIEVLQSETIKDFILKTYNGAAIPV